MPIDLCSSSTGICRLEKLADIAVLPFCTTMGLAPSIQFPARAYQQAGPFHSWG